MNVLCKVQEREIQPGDNGVATSPRMAPAAPLPPAPDALVFLNLVSLQKEKPRYRSGTSSGCAACSGWLGRQAAGGQAAGRAIPLLPGTLRGPSLLSAVKKNGVTGSRL